MNTELLLPLLGEWLAKGIAILLVATSIVRLWRRSSAAQRHFVWLAALTTLLLLPATRLVAPRWKMSLERPVTVRIPAAAPAATPVEAAPAEPAAQPVAPASEVWRLPDWRILLASVWGAGVAGLLGSRWLGSWRLRRIERASTGLDDSGMMELAQGVFREIGIRQEVTVRISRECRVPMTWGIRRAVLVLPEEAREWNETRLAAALRHEAGHIRRRDYLVRWIAHVACAIYWPNPLVWLAARSLRVAQEQATDDLVLRAGTPAKEYAAQLCDAARTVATQGVFARHAVAMATPSTLENRVLAIVDERRDRRPLSRLGVVAGSSVVALTLGVCAVAQLRGADPAPVAPGAAAPEGGQPQVLIEAKFMEITGDAAELDPGLTAEKSVYTDPQFQVILRALNQRKGVDLLSAPRVTTRPNQAALVQVEREFRYPTEWIRNAKGQWEPSAFGMKMVGVTLDVTPVIGADGSVELRLKPSVVEFRGFTDLDGPKDAKALTTSEVPAGKNTLVEENGKRMQPLFSERNLDTTIKLKSGETVALGALMEQGDAKAFVKNPVPRRLVVFVSAAVINGPAVVDAKPNALVLGDLAVAETPPAVPSAAKAKADSIIIPRLDDGVSRPTPEAIPVPGKPGFVISPYEPSRGYIDVRGFPPGTEVKDPYTTKSFLVPRLPAPDAGKATPKLAEGLLQQTPKESRIESRAGREEAPADPAKVPVAIPVPGKPGFVISPYDKYKGYIDVRGFPAGTEVKDPYSGKPFLVPAPDAGKTTPTPPPLDLLQQTTPKESRIEGRAGIEIRSANGAVDLIPTRRHGSISF
jgi:beta-lactamase regulating signal transducer with metallopeptidase domain